TIQTSDGDSSDLESRDGTVNITVKEINDLVVGSPTNSTNEDVPVSGKIGRAASRGEGHTITAAAVTDLATTAGGKVTINSDGSYTYSPPAGYDGPDSFSFTIQTTDGDSSDLESRDGTVNITVKEINDLVVGSPTNSTNEDVPVSG